MEFTREFIETLSIKGLSPDEQETIVNFGINDELANVYTSDRTVWTKLKKGLLQDNSEYKLVRVSYSRDGDPVAVEVEFPKEFVCFRQKHKEISDEQRQAAGDRLRKMWEDKKVDT